MSDQLTALLLSAESSDPARPDATHSFREGLRKALLPVHLEHSTAPIDPPGPSGAFPSRAFGLPFVIVVDASRLRDDVLRRSISGSRTTLVTAASAGDFRLFAAQHVIDEVFEHAPRWCSEKEVEPDVFLDCWRDEYLSVIRIVDVAASHLALLNADELARVDERQARDPDDVPSITLAILLQAFYLSNDLGALEAVYGDRFDPAVHERWLQILQAGSDARQLAEFGRASLMLTNAAGKATNAGVKRLVTATGPWILALLLMVVGIAIARMSSQSRRRLVQGSWDTVAVLAETHSVQRQLASSFTDATPDDPNWELLAGELQRAYVLVRACLHVLARHAESNLSAEQLATALPSLGVPQSATAIRRLLRADGVFCEVWRGYWQLGRPHIKEREL